MKSLICVKPGQWEVQETKAPQRKEGEALLKISCIGICGTDLHAFQGNQPFLSYPRILGHEFAAEVIEIDENEYGILPRDKVTTIPYLSCGKCLACRKGATNCCSNISVLGVHTDGAMRDYISVPVPSLIKVNHLSDQDVALIECLAIGAHAIRRAAVQEGENVFIAGAGPIGIAALQFAKANGATVTMIDINEDRLDYCREEFGVETINPMIGNVENKIYELTNGDMGDVVIDATGNAKAMVQAIQYCAHSARLVYIGLNKGELPISHTEIHKRELTILCSRNATKEDFLRVIECLENKTVKSSSMVTHQSSFIELPDRFSDWIKSDTGVIKAIVNMT